MTETPDNATPDNATPDNATPDNVIPDSAARERIETSLDESLLVEAAAGTGKTTELVRRLVAILQHGKTTVDRVVAVTFTRKAAGELKLRLRQELDTARGKTEDPTERAHLEEALARLEEARIGTIHSFCTDILRERPVEARVDPAFVEMDEEETSRLFDKAFRGWIERKLDEMPDGLRRALARLANQRSPQGTSPIDRLRDAARGLAEWRDFQKPWRRQPFERYAELRARVAEVLKIADLCRRCENRHDYLRKALLPADALAAWLHQSAAVRDGATSERDQDELEARLVELLRELKRNLNWRGRGRWFAPNIPREEALEARDRLIESLEDFKRQADADLAALLQEELQEVTEAYEDVKRRHGRLDFLDLLIRTRDLVRDDADVRRFLSDQYTHLFIDEFQDTDPLQVEILLLLAADDPSINDWRQARPVPGKLFLVGDPKQSIYRFRRADVVLYEDVKEMLIERGVTLVHLSCSFRSLQPIQDAVNGAFADVMTGDRKAGQPRYVALDPHRQPPAEQPPQPRIVALPVPKPYGFSRITARSIDQSLPDAVAGFIHFLTEQSGWTVVDPEEGEVPIRPRHIALLFRRFLSWGEDVTRHYTRGLEARGVPHLLVGGRSFHQREEVETLRAALMAVEWPDDELAIYATLRGGLFAISDADLLRFRAEVAPLHPFRVPEDLPENFVPVYEALRLLARLHQQRNKVPIVETLNELLDATRAHAGFALRPAGNQVLANVQRIADLARSFEIRGGLSFRGFVERLSAEAAKVGATQGPVLEEGADGVRIMTAHAAKGLEFPVVILADITARLSRDEPSLYVDPAAGLCAQKLLGCAPWELVDELEIEQVRDRAEGIRLAYVAATRARDLLVVPGVGDEPWNGGWTSPLDPAIYPEKQRYRDAVRPVEGCPSFGDSSVLMRSERFALDADMSVMPGLHHPQAGNHEVVWWDPKTLELDVDGSFGLRQEMILSENNPEAAEEGGVRYQEWRSEQRDAREDGGEPLLELTIVTSAEDEAPNAGSLPIRVEKLEKRSSKRPSGIRFGTLVHTILRDVSFNASAAAVRDLAQLHARLLDAPEDEIRAAAKTVRDTLKHPLMLAAASAERCHREAPFLVEVEEGEILEGTIDMLFFNEGLWTVVDFKTDADLDEMGERYRQQLGWYLFAVERMMKAPVEGVLLSI